MQNRHKICAIFKKACLLAILALFVLPGCKKTEQPASPSSSTGAPQSLYTGTVVINDSRAVDVQASFKDQSGGIYLGKVTFNDDPMDLADDGFTYQLSYDTNLWAMRYPSFILSVAGTKGIKPFTDTIASLRMPGISTLDLDSARMIHADAGYTVNISPIDCDSIYCWIGPVGKKIGGAEHKFVFSPSELLLKFSKYRSNRTYVQVAAYRFDTIKNLRGQITVLHARTISSSLHFRFH